MYKRVGSAVALLLAGGLIAAGAFACSATAATPNWQITTVRAHGADQFGISCWTDSNCMTVGLDYAFLGGASAQIVGDRVVSVRSLRAYQAVDCRPNWCLSVGVGLLTALSQRWSGGSWSKQTAIIHSSERNSLSFSDISHVSCPSRHVCYATGLTLTLLTTKLCQTKSAPADCVTETTQVVALRAGRWRRVLSVTRPIGSGPLSSSVGVVNFTRPRDLAAELSSDAATDPEVSFGPISCPAIGHCVMIGDSISKAHETLFADVLSGHRWTKHTIRRSGVLQQIDMPSVYCRAARSCVAVGADSSVQRKPQLRFLNRVFVATWNGHHWDTRALPAPRSLKGAYLDSVSCDGAGGCMAVGGGDLKRGGHRVPVSYALTGGRWTPLATPVPKRSRWRGGSYLAGVSCPSVDTCTAVGNYAGRLPGWFLERYTP